MDRLSPALALLVGLALLGGPFVLFPHAGQQDCVNIVEEVARAEIPDDAAVLRYADLSSDAQRAFARALADPDGRATVYGDRCPSEFHYSDVLREHYVQRDGNYYVLETVGGGGLFPRGILLGLGFGLIGVAFITLGGNALYRGEITQLQELAYGGLAGFGVVLLILAAAEAELFLVIGLTVAAVVISYVLLGYDLPVKAAATFVGIVTLAVIGFLLWFGFTGSMVVVVFLPIVLTVVGIVVRLLRSELLP